MSAPVAVGLATIVATSVAQQLGTRVGDAIADGIFGRANEIQDIQKKLDILNTQLQEVLLYARSTYALVENLPNIISGIIDQQTLYLAHNDIESSIQAYMRLQQWHGTIGYETLTNLLKSWNIVIDKEASTEKLVFLPRYGEFLLLVTHGQLYDAIHSGIKQKLEIVERLAANLANEKITPWATEIESILKSEHVQSGVLLNESPWVTWVMQGPRTRETRKCRIKPCKYCNGGIEICQDYTVPDETWNSTITSKNARLQELSQDLGALIKQLQSAIFAKEALSRYLAMIVTRKHEESTLEHIRVIESDISFPLITPSSGA